MSATAARARAERPPRRARGAAWLAAALALAACAGDDVRPPAAAPPAAAPPAASVESAAAPDGSGDIGSGAQPAPAPAATATAAAAPAEPPPPPDAAPLPSLMELDRAALRALMGRPAFAWEQPGAAMWRYDGPRCELFVFLHDHRVRHVEAQGANAARRAACLARLLAARP